MDNEQYVRDLLRTINSEDEEIVKVIAAVLTAKDNEIKRLEAMVTELTLAASYVITQGK